MLKHCFLALLLCLGALPLLWPSGTALAAAPRSAADKLRLSWPLLPGAVRYQVRLLEGDGEGGWKLLQSYNDVFAPGLELSLSVLPLGVPAGGWQVQGFDRQGHRVGESEIYSMGEAEKEPTAPLTLDEYGAMAYLPVYPVYAWVPVLHASSYEVEVWRAADAPGGQAERVRHFYTYEAIVYDTEGFKLAGHYWWRVRALDEEGRRYSDWSPPVNWQVTAPTMVAAIGDSITHGGGTIMTPPCRTLYNWQTYSAVPVKNIGCSGDTTAMMAERFEEDVLPFVPQILVIMGGVNDFRVGTPASVSIHYLAKIGEKCHQYGITPVFVTAPPIHPGLMAGMAEIEAAAEDWQEQQARLNDWIMAQKYAVDVATALADEVGNLRAEYTSDGLHPDHLAKRYIGETIGAYLAAQFPARVSR